MGLVPDLLTLSKAIGNGWPVAAVLGRRDVLEAAAGMHYSGTFHGDTAAMAAAMATLEIEARESAAEHAWSMGERLISGLASIARAHGIAAEVYAEPLPPMPFVRFHDADAEVNERVKRTFYEQTLEAGVLFHPRHMWFLSAAHSAMDVERALGAADKAMAAAKRAV
ncbi:MAG: aminotransferase class III-fold pyridoxal phosphate-dependent enzyme [Polyangiaceae bacterium]